MSNAVSVISKNAVIQNEGFTPEQMTLITRTIAPTATADELKLFLYRCKNMNLDPLKPGQIYFIKYGSGSGTIVVGIDGFRAKAQQSGKLAGIKRGVVRNDKGACIGAWAEVYRSDWKEPAREEVSLSEYNTGKSQWAKMPETMIKKVAEAAALRMAFPDDLGGVYAKEEMDQAEEERKVVPQQPEPEDGVQNAEVGYRIPFGKFAKRGLHEVDPRELAGYIAYLEGQAEKKNQPITGQVKDFIERADKYLADLEAAPLEPGSNG